MGTVGGTSLILILSSKQNSIDIEDDENDPWEKWDMMLRSVEDRSPEKHQSYEREM